MSQNSFRRFEERHPYLLNSLLIVAASIAAVYIGLLFIDVFTSHGRQKQVPDVRNMPLVEAINVLESAGFNWEISDSTTFDEHMRPGQVLDIDPRPGSYIKQIRSVYLKVNAMHPRLVGLPRLVEESGRQSLAKLRALGFKNVTVDSVPSTNNGLILKVTVNGRAVAEGTPVSVNALIRLTVGDGSILDQDPTYMINEQEIDSIEQKAYEEALRNYELQEN